MYSARLITRSRSRAQTGLLFGSVLLLAACKDSGASSSEKRSDSPSALESVSGLAPASTGLVSDSTRLAPDLTGLELFAASSALRVVDAATGHVAARVDLNKTVNGIAVSADGATAFLATSGGVFRFDARTHVLGDQLTTSPARRVRLDEANRHLFVLEHDVVVTEQGGREIRPFRLRRVDVASGRVEDVEEVGQRVAFVVPSEGGRNHLVITEAGTVFIGRHGSSLMDGEALSLGDRPYQIRGAAEARGHVFIALDAGSSSEIADVDLATGGIRHIAIGPFSRVRGIDASADGKTVVVVAGSALAVVDVSSGQLSGGVELPGHHQGVRLSPDGKAAFVLKTSDGTGGSVSWVNLNPLRYGSKIEIGDITPWTLAVRSRAEPR